MKVPRSFIRSSNTWMYFFFGGEWRLITWLAQISLRRCALWYKSCTWSNTRMYSRPAATLPFSIFFTYFIILLCNFSFWVRSFFISFLDLISASLFSVINDFILKVETFITVFKFLTVLILLSSITSWILTTEPDKNWLVDSSSLTFLLNTIWLRISKNAATATSEKTPTVPVL